MNRRQRRAAARGEKARGARCRCGWELPVEAFVRLASMAPIEEPKPTGPEVIAIIVVCPRCRTEHGGDLPKVAEHNVTIEDKPPAERD